MVSGAAGNPVVFQLERSHTFFHSRTLFCGKVCAFLPVHPTRSTAQCLPGQLPRDLYRAPSTSHLNRPLQPLSVTREGYSWALTARKWSSRASGFCVRPQGLAQHVPRSPNFQQTNTTPCHNLLRRKFQEASDVQAYRRLSEQPGFVPDLNDVLVVLWAAQPVGLQKPARKDNVCRLDDRRLRARPSKITSEPLVSRPATPDSREELGTHTDVGHLPLLHLRALRIQRGLLADRCHSCPLPTRPHPPVRLSSSLLRVAPRKPQQQSPMILFFCGVGHSSRRARKQLIVPSRHHGKRGQPPPSDSHRCRSQQLLEDPTNCQQTQPVREHVQSQHT